MSGSPSPNAAAHHNPRQGPLITAIMFSFFALLLFVCMCYYHRVSRRNGENPRRNSTTRSPAAVGTASSSCHPNGKLKPELLAALPVFVCPLMPPRERLECAVCLAEFREGEMGRVLPRCRHSFHTACIDVWLGSHSTCPLCRVEVDSEPPDSAV